MSFVFEYFLLNTIIKSRSTYKNIDKKNYWYWDKTHKLWNLEGNPRQSERKKWNQGERNIT